MVRLSAAVLRRQTHEANAPSLVSRQTKLTSLGGMMVTVTWRIHRITQSFTAVLLAVVLLSQQSAFAGARTIVVGPQVDRLASTAIDRMIIAMLKQQGASRIRLAPWDADRARRSVESVGARIPVDAFRVWSTWATYFKDGRYHVVFYGHWAFRPRFIGSGAPDDVSGVAVQGFSARCWTKVSDGMNVVDSRGGVHNHLRYRKRAGARSTVYGVRDHTRAFQLDNTVGLHWIDMRRDRTGCRGRKSGSYFYEHNQNGSGGWSAGIGVGALSVSYSGSGGDVLQKAARFNYFK